MRSKPSVSCTGLGRQRQHGRAHDQEHQSEREVNRVMQGFPRQGEKAERKHSGVSPLHKEQGSTTNVKYDDEPKRLDALEQDKENLMPEMRTHDIQKQQRDGIARQVALHAEHADDQYRIVRMSFMRGSMR